VLPPPLALEPLAPVEPLAPDPAVPPVPELGGAPAAPVPPPPSRLCIAPPPHPRPANPAQIATAATSIPKRVLIGSDSSVTPFPKMRRAPETGGASPKSGAIDGARNAKTR
jgi:hypothetical protein